MAIYDLQHLQKQPLTGSYSVPVVKLFKNTCKEVHFFGKDGYF